MNESSIQVQNVNEVEDQGIQLYNAQQKILASRVQIINIITAVSITLYAVTIIASVILVWPLALSYVTILVFFCLGTGFLIAGLLMITALRKYFVDFYNSVNTVLWVATLLLTVPMFIRAVNNALRIWIEPYETWYMDNIMITDSMNIVITTFFPVVA